jgi:hypothetical protein
MHVQTVPQAMASAGTYNEGRTRVMTKFDGTSKQRYAMKKIEISMA